MSDPNDLPATPVTHSKPAQEIPSPTADIRRQPGLGERLGSQDAWLIWSVPAVALALGLGLVWYSFHGRGPKVTVRFPDGHGLAAGNAVRYRGIDVGEVIAVELTAPSDGVRVVLRLEPSSRQLARQGTRFWIERPRVSLSRVSGLETVVGAKYVGLIPGPEEGREVYQFEGLESPPVGEERREGGLEIVLESPHRHGLEMGAPVTYRGLQVGHVLAVGLAPDASTVEARVYLQPAYRNLLRNNSQFWNLSGFDVDVRLTGIRLTAETLATIAAGGVAFATPDDPGKTVATGHRFRLHSQPEDSWSTWRPRLSIPSTAAPHVSPLPQPVRALLRWKEKRFGFERQRQRDGWVLHLVPNQLLGPTDLLTVPAQAIDQSATLELDGREISLATGATESRGSISVYTLPPDVTIPSARWPRSRLRSPQQLEDTLLVPGWQEPATVLAAAHLQPGAEQTTWRVADHVGIPADLHGAVVVSTADGKLIGVTVVNQGQPHVVPLPAGMPAK